MSKAKIVSNPKILGGKPVIYGTRISVELIMNFLGAGMSIDEILLDYPELTKEEIRACIQYAAKLVTDANRPHLNSRSSIIVHEIIGR